MATRCGFLKLFSQFKGDLIIFKDAFGFYSDQIFLCTDGHSGFCQTGKFPAGSSYSWKPEERTPELNVLLALETHVSCMILY